jgi:hypothetical protein
VDLAALAGNRINGTTIPLYDKRSDLYGNELHIVDI